jgi:hypothetical protein
LRGNGSVDACVMRAGRNICFVPDKERVVLRERTPSPQPSPLKEREKN